MANGTVKKLFADRGFGFIKGEDGKELFFHVSGCGQGAFDTLAEGTSVSYDVDTKPNPKGKGPRAINVRK